MSDTGQGTGTAPGNSGAPGQQLPRDYVPRERPPGASGGAPPGGPPNPPPPPAGERAESGAEGRSPSRSAASDWLNRLLGRTPVRSDAAGDEGGPRGEPASRPGAPPGEPSPRSAPPGQPAEGWAPPASQEDEERRIQSEIDRRVARANKQRDEQGRFVRQQRVQGLKDQARQARQTDVYKAAELEEQVDALEQQEAFVRGLVEHYDRVSIDPIMQALPEADRAPLLADLPDGLDGRLQLVRAALRKLEQVWRADEARKLRGGAQRKRENAVRRAQAVEDDGEPELVSGIGRGRNGKTSMNDWLHNELNRR